MSSTSRCGKPAAGMFVEVHALDGDIRRVVGTGRIGDNGVFAHPMNAGDGVHAGVHEVLLHAGDYFRSVGLVQRQARRSRRSCRCASRCSTRASTTTCR